MPKAKTIDRVALTRSHSKHLQENNKINSANTENTDTTENKSKDSFGRSTCPACEENTLIHEEGCAHCLNCGWSACG